MDVLIDKQYKDYNYVSRYNDTPFYYNTLDKKYIYGVAKHLSKDTEYTVHNIVDNDSPDSLALKYYGRPDYYWVILDFNDIKDPYIKLIDKYINIRIPSLSNIEFK